MSFADDPTQGAGGAGDDPLQGGVTPDLSGDPSQGIEHGATAMEDPTGGIEIGEDPREDPTQGGEVGELAGEDPSEA
jgi:hypothetical protein